jgi:flagellar protein FliO/FliZ
MDPVRYISAIILVAALLALAIWVLRRFNVAGVGVPSRLKVVSHLSVGTREKLLVVRFGEEDVLLGITPHSITRLGAVPADSEGQSAERFRAELESQS